MNDFTYNVGDRVSWRTHTRGPSVVKTGVLIYDGEPSVEIPGFDTGTWLSQEEYELLRDLHGRIRFSDISGGVIVRVDRHHQYTHQELVPWYYAPERSALGPEVS